MVTANSTGPTVLYTRETGKMDVQMEEVFYITLMETYTKENGKTIKHMAMVNTFMLMVLRTLGSGKKISSTDKGLRRGLMEQNFKGLTSMARNTVKGLCILQTNPSMKENFNITRFAVSEDTSGQMASLTLANGKIIRCLEKELSNGATAEYMRENLLMIKEKDAVCLHGQMGAGTTEYGKKASSME